ncbi:MAG: prephenate dehydratase [Candidatus Limivicinus sp.]|nr:prephenate dehydratase [Candidatus Limivicinus sp.]
MDRSDYRKQIDRIDEQLVKLFAERMEVAGRLAEYKKENSLPVLDVRREREKLHSVSEQSPEELRDYTELLYSLIFELSRSYQNRLIGTGTELTARIEDAVKNTPPLFPERAAVACQGIEGAYSQIACSKLMRSANTLYFSSFDAVFSAIEKGLCRYGVIPLENSTAGSVNTVYDLMMRHRFSIVRSVRLKIDHSLLAKPGVKVENIKEIYSHEQAIAQCRGFLQTMPGVKVTACDNTAMAAKLVAESGRDDIAALSSRDCARLYGLDCIRENVQDRSNNYTRFICISKDLEIYPGANRTSLMVTLAHRPGTLYKLLSRFYALDINLNKLESRPIPDRDFEFMFYFDLDVPVYSPKFIQLMGELDSICESFTYLGSYSEVI